MHYKTVANLLDRHDADQQVVRIRVKNPRASIIMTGTVNGEPRYISKRGCDARTCPVSNGCDDGGDGYL
jgi:hypothetical protein